MLVEIFKGVFVRADRIEAVRVRDKEVMIEIKHPCEDYTHQPRNAFPDEDHALMHANAVKRDVNMALERGRG